MQKGGCAYIITNKNYTVLYIGITSNLLMRAHQQKTGAHPKNIIVQNWFIIAAFTALKKLSPKKKESKAVS